MRSKEEVSAEIEKLRDIERRVQPRSIFGDDNVGAVRAQIKVLEQWMGEYQVYLSFDHNDHLLDGALYAHDWMMEQGLEDEGPPSEGWLPLCREDD